MSNLTDQILQREKVAKDYLTTKRTLWDSVENIFTNKLDDKITDKTKSQIFDPKLATMTIERSNRVMAQLPTGKIKAISRNDEGTSQLMNLVNEKYVIPNASAQFDFLTKCRMIDLYSNIYGNFFAFVDWDVKKNGYVGPDMWLLNIRDVLPQVGAVSLEDSDYVIVRTWKPYSYFEGLKNQKGFKNIGTILKLLKEKTGDKESRDVNTKTSRESNVYLDAVAAKGKGYFEVLSMYERDRWVDYVPDCHDDGVFRDIDNPHDNGELPVVCKYSIPLLDDFMGMGDFERGQSMQMGMNSLWNLYLDAVKISIFPPVLINKDNVAEASSLKFSPAAKWLGRNQLGNMAQTLNLTPQGISTFNNTYQVFNAAMLNMFGTTDTATTAETDPNFGKTPQALKMQGARENTRDNADRFYMEQFLKKVINRFTNLLSKKQSGALQVRLFEEEIKELSLSYPEIQEMYDEQSGKITIPKNKFGSVVFDYEIVSGSTYATDQDKQQSNLLALLEMFLKNPQLAQTMMQEQKELKLGELVKRIMANSGIQDWDKILVDVSKGQNLDSVLNAHATQFQAALMGVDGMNQVPPTPGGQPAMPPQMPQQPMQQPQMGGMPNGGQAPGYPA